MDANGLPDDLPMSIGDVEQLVKRLYAPNNPREIKRIDDQLKLLQLSSQGWQLADVLMGSQDANVRFFAALTFQVKLNHDGSKLDAETAQTVLMKLLSWLVRSVFVKLTVAGESFMVLKKLCSCLSNFSMRSPEPWNVPLRHLAHCFVRGDAVPQDQLAANDMDLRAHLDRLTEPQQLTLLWLSGTMATDAVRADSTSATHARIHTQMETTVKDASDIISFILERRSENLKMRTDCLACFLNWVNYAQPMWHHRPEALAHLQVLIYPIISMLSPSDIQSEVMDVMRDVLESYTSFFQQEHMIALGIAINEFVRPRLLEGLAESEPEVLSPAQLVVAYGIANIQHVVQRPDDTVGSRSIVEQLFAILQAPGYPGDDDEVSSASIEFWNTYIEFVNDAIWSLPSDQGRPAWLDYDKSVCLEVSRLLWAKMRTPPPEVAQEWSVAESEGFKEFRMDASDLILSLYVRLGNELFQSLVTLALNALASRNWIDLEASLFCLNTLADNVLEDQNAEHLLGQLFRSSLFRDIADFQHPIPTQPRKTAIDTLGAYGQYIEHHAEFLPDTLRFLFASLESQGLCDNSAKSIEALCGACRNSLTGELDGFLAQYHSFARSKFSNSYTNERVIGAIAAIVQAVSPESAKAAPLSALHDCIDVMMSNARTLQEQNDENGAGEWALQAVDCLARMGKSLQLPDDTPIDIYEDGDKPPNREDYWSSTEGQAVQSRIVATCYAALSLRTPNIGEIVDSVCNVFKTGYVETQPGPFVFPRDWSVSFLEQCSSPMPHMESVLSMICTLVAQHSRSNSERVDEQIARIYKAIVREMKIIQDPSLDPAVAQNCIDILTRMLGRYTHILLDTNGTGDMVQFVLDFTLTALDGTDITPKRAAADFWAKMMKPSDPTDQAVKERSETIVAAYGPLLCQVLVNQFTGQGYRSELDSLCEPLKVMLSHRPQTKTWLETALLGEKAPQINHIGESDRRRFVQQLVALRGDLRKTRDVVKNFYAACRGTVTSFS